ncbi:MAG TPA: ABC transporter substrate-binding protein [Gemmatimonadales bacterium]|jgi:iron complex transport system substrate-binding protein
MRVVSLLPAATEIVAAIGAADRLVGVSHECDWPEGAVRDRPRVTRTWIDTSLPSRAIDRQVSQAGGSRPPIELDLEALRRARPDILIGQAVCEVCAVGAGEMARALGALEAAPRVVTLHAHDLAGVWNDIGRVGEALDLSGEAEELVAGLRYRLRRLHHHIPHPASRIPRVLVVEWLEPPYVAGHWVPELVTAAGGVDVAARHGDRSLMRPWAELRDLSPEIVVIALCGFDVPRARRELAATTDPDAQALFASARVVFLDGNAYTSRPGPRLVEGAEILAGLIHG